MGAGIVGLLASLTRINGVLLMIPFLIEIIINERKKEGGFEIKSFLKKSLPMLLILLGPLMFFIYHYVQFGDFFAFFNVESTFGRSFVVNQDHLAGSDFVSRSNMYFDMTIAILVFIAGVITMYRVRLSYGLYILATLFLPLSTGTLMSIGRYVLVAFPIFILMASFKNIYIKWSYVLVSILMCAMITILFVNNGWAG